MEEMSQHRKKIVVVGNSLGLFEPKNKIRQLCFRIVNFKYYDNVILGLIGVSTVLLTLDNPLYD